MLNKKLPAIAFFVYNRPEHTRITINKLINNNSSKKYEIYIFADAPKKLNDKLNVQKVRNFLKEIKHFKKIKIIKRKKNLGLSRSLRQGLDYLFSFNDKVIIIEDDNLTNRYFLDYMSGALNYYENEHYIGSVSGYSFTDQLPNDYKKNMYLGYRHSSWGWGTWKHVWKEINWDKRWINNRAKRKNFRKLFNIGGNDMYHILLEQIKGNIDSWSIIFDLNCFILKKFCACPKKSLVQNIGFDGSGVHCKENMDVFNNFDKKFTIKRFYSLEINNKIIKSIKNSFKVSLIYKIRTILNLF